MPDEGELHEGALISGEVTCTCGWSSGHFALASEAAAEFDQHLIESVRPKQDAS